MICVTGKCGGVLVFPDGLASSAMKGVGQGAWILEVSEETPPKRLEEEEELDAEIQRLRKRRREVSAYRDFFFNTLTRACITVKARVRVWLFFAYVRGHFLTRGRVLREVSTLWNGMLAEWALLIIMYGHVCCCGESDVSRRKVETKLPSAC